MPPEVFYLEVGPFAIVPVCHYRAEFACEVRRAFAAFRPTRVALELPSFLGPPFQRAVARFPNLTVLSYQVPLAELSVEDERLMRLLRDVDGADERAREEAELELYRLAVEAREGRPTSETQTMILPVEPTDAFAEACRSAIEASLPVHYVDLNLRDYMPGNAGVPDSCSVASVGGKAYFELWKEKVGPSRNPLDRQREAHMVQNLRELARVYPEDRFLVVAGIAHCQAIAEGLAAPSWERRDFQESGPPAQVTVGQPDLDSIRQIAQETPILMALYELQRGGPGYPQAWQSPPKEEEPPPAAPPSLLDQMSSNQLMTSLEALLGHRKKRELPADLKPSQVKAVADYLQRLVQQPLAFADLMSQMTEGRKQDELRLPQLPPPDPVKVFTFRQVEDRREHLRAIYSRITDSAWSGQWDRQRVQLGLLKTAAAFYEENTGETIKPWQLETFARFSRNYAMLKGWLLPGLFELIMGARAVADDNFSYEMWDFGTFYPWTETEDGVETIRVDGEMLFLGNQPVEHWRFHRKLPTRQRMRRTGVKKRAHEESEGDWGEDFKKGSLCSYPPEDIVIEDYGRFLQKKALALLSSEKTRVEPFSTSLLDGIDMRETLRNWHEKKIYVRESQRAHGDVGSVVVIFDEDHEDRFPWLMSWHGEHNQESDMAFFATPMYAKVVGPGIARCEYGGFMLTYPPGRLSDVWRDPFYRDAQNKAEVLLMAGLDYSEDKHVVYVAAKPPRSHFRSVAARMGKKVCYIPIGQLSPVTLKKIRVFHVLSDHRKRDIAKNYVW